MFYRGVHDLNRSVDSAQFLSRNHQFGRKGTELAQGKRFFPRIGSVFSAFERYRLDCRGGIVVFPLEHKFRFHHFTGVVQARADGVRDEVPARIKLVAAVRNDGVLLRNRCGGGVDVFKAEIVKTERIERGSARDVGSKHPDVVVIGIRLDFEAFRKVFPFRFGTEGEGFQHGIIAVAILIGKRAKIDGIGAERLKLSVLVRQDFGVEGDFHFAVAGQHEIGKLKLPVRNAGITRDHQPLPVLSLPDGDGGIDFIGRSLNSFERGAVDAEEVSGRAFSGDSELHSGVAVEELPGGEQERSGEKRRAEKMFHDRLLFSLCSSRNISPRFESRANCC